MGERREKREKRWVFAPADRTASSKLARSLQVSDLTATLLVNRGKQEEAAALADAAQVSADGDFDPWWTYWLGDFRAYPTYLDKLRELGR